MVEGWKPGLSDVLIHVVPAVLLVHLGIIIICIRHCLARRRARKLSDLNNLFGSRLSLLDTENQPETNQRFFDQDQVSP